MKKLFSLLMGVVTLLTLSVPAFAAETIDSSLQEYQAVVEEVNDTYGVKLTLYEVPDMSVEDYRARIVDMAIASNAAKEKFLEAERQEAMQQAHVVDVMPSNTRATEYVTLGGSTGMYNIDLYCTNVRIENADNGDRIIASALSSNVHSHVNGWINPVTYIIEEPHAMIYDRGLSLGLSATGTLIIPGTTPLPGYPSEPSEIWDDYYVSVNLNTNDTYTP